MGICFLSVDSIEIFGELQFSFVCFLVGHGTFVCLLYTSVILVYPLQCMMHLNIGKSW